MNIRKAEAIIEIPEIFDGMLARIERAGRTCYKSENLITETTAPAFALMLLDRKHEAMIEHGGVITVRFIVDRGISHELVRHRLASYAQESTRYCNYTKGKFGDELTFIKPFFWPENSLAYKVWAKQCLDAEISYRYLISLGATPQEARSILPNSLKTEVVMTANPREWRAFFSLRTPESAHPQMREVTIPLLKEFASLCPPLFADLLADIK